MIPVCKRLRVYKERFPHPGWREELVWRVRGHCGPILFFCRSFDEAMELASEHFATYHPQRQLHPAVLLEPGVQYLQWLRADGSRAYGLPT